MDGCKPMLSLWMDVSLCCPYGCKPTCMLSLWIIRTDNIGLCPYGHKRIYVPHILSIDMFQPKYGNLPQQCWVLYVHVNAHHTTLLHPHCTDQCHNLNTELCVYLELF